MSDLHDSSHEHLPTEWMVSHDEALDQVKDGNADGIGFTTTHHDDVLFVEVTNARKNEISLADPVLSVLSSFGVTWVDIEIEKNIARATYDGHLPDEAPDPSTVLLTTDGDDHKIRISDSGWFPIFGNTLNWGDGDDDINSIDDNNLRQFLQSTGVIG